MTIRHTRKGQVDRCKAPPNLGRFVPGNGFAERAWAHTINATRDLSVKHGAVARAQQRSAPSSGRMRHGRFGLPSVPPGSLRQWWPAHLAKCRSPKHWRLKGVPLRTTDGLTLRQAYGHQNQKGPIERCLRPSTLASHVDASASGKIQPSCCTSRGVIVLSIAPSRRELLRLITLRSAVEIRSPQPIQDNACACCMVTRLFR